jgi:hypothetical protein
MHWVGAPYGLPSAILIKMADPTWQRRITLAIPSASSYVPLVVGDGMTASRPSSNFIDPRQV